MSGSERRKGSGGELEVARIFQAAGFDCDRTPNSGGLRIRGDLHGELPLHVEVKRQETARPWLWAEQARVDAGAGERWVVAMRRSRDEWVAMLPLVDLVRLLELERRADQQHLRDALGAALTRLENVDGDLALTNFDAQVIIRDALAAEACTR